MFVKYAQCARIVFARVGRSLAASFEPEMATDASLESRRSISRRSVHGLHFIARMCSDVSRLSFFYKTMHRSLESSREAYANLLEKTCIPSC